MSRLKRFLSAQRPDWAEHGHAVQRYTRGQPGGRHHRIVRVMAICGAALALLLMGVLARMVDAPLSRNEAHLYTFYAVLYFPLLLIQFLALMVAIQIAFGAIVVEQQRGTWETFKITSHGAELFVRARWRSILDQLRIALTLVIGARLIFAVFMLVDVTREHGTYLDLYRSGITPAVPLEGAVLLLAALITAALLQFPVLLGLNAAIGLLIAGDGSAPDGAAGGAPGRAGRTDRDLCRGDDRGRSGAR